MRRGGEQHGWAKQGYQEGSLPWRETEARGDGGAGGPRAPQIWHHTDPPPGMWGQGGQRGQAPVLSKCWKLKAGGTQGRVFVPAGPHPDAPTLLLRLPCSRRAQAGGGDLALPLPWTAPKKADEEGLELLALRTSSSTKRGSHESGLRCRARGKSLAPAASRLPGPRVPAPCSPQPSPRPQPGHGETEARGVCPAHAAPPAPAPVAPGPPGTEHEVGLSPASAAPNAWHCPGCPAPSPPQP